ncbi:hypothetical protein [Salmonella bongori]|uniref:Uncharacterized protein n=2 Tax=Salmonella bongori TaxID=54736 RepID=A0A702BPL1_SALBN|nr:hypothetical protein [Salmonella bongori]AID27048.1 hypothetical protein N643_04020 [Salmonella bongori serovar 48:z41:-- str. RKS3044]EGS1131545.1 hypothetical protein [Salmonella bongori CFSAN000509]QXY85028.1 hypothetical protein EWI73_14385 [Salmonella bongori]HAC6696674.1 hypothetical protein [Salmonella bongori serovar 44:r:-]
MFERMCRVADDYFTLFVKGISAQKSVWVNPELNSNYFCPNLEKWGLGYVHSNGAPVNRCNEKREVSAAGMAAINRLKREAEETKKAG